VKQLGQAIVLRFTSAALSARWRQFRAGGASWDYAQYQPHITITYRAPAGWLAAMSKIAPFAGTLRFGPERYREVSDGAGKQVPETPTASRRPKRVLFARRAS
jgi:hypothetical protein